MAKKFLSDSQKTSDNIYPLSDITIKMNGTTAELSNWILECTDKDDDIDDNDSWDQCSENGYDWTIPGGAVENFKCSSGYIYRLRRTSGDAGATASWAHNFILVRR